MIVGVYGIILTTLQIRDRIGSRFRSLIFGGSPGSTLILGHESEIIPRPSPRLIGQEPRTVYYHSIIIHNVRDDHNYYNNVNTSFSNLCPKHAPETVYYYILHIIMLYNNVYYI